MRTLAFIGAAAIAVTIAASNSAWAWSTEGAAQQGTNGVDLTDPDNFKALEDKVNSNTLSQNGFFVSGGINGGSGDSFSQTNPYGLSPLQGRNSGFSYSPIPGFRGQPQ